MAKRSKNTIGQVAQAVRKHKKFLVVAHECPDGDSLGSAMAMAHALRKMKKDARIITDMVPEKYRFLPGVAGVLHEVPADVAGRVAMLFDTPTPDRLGVLKDGVQKASMLINIDHHISNHLYGDINWVDVQAASVGEQIYKLLKLLRVKVDRDIASCLYTSVVTDTGKFQYGNTTPFTHALASELLSTGIGHAKINEHIYEDYPIEKLRLLSGALATLRMECAGKVATMVVSQDLLRQTGLSMEWSDDAINYARGVRGAEVAVVFKEAEEGTFRVSFRSRNTRVADVNKVARLFGGGGHRAASGCSAYGTLEEVREQILAPVRKIYGG